MKENEFKTLDPVADQVNEEVGKWIESDALSELKEALRRVSASLPETYAIELAVQLRIFDSERERSLTLLNSGLCTIGGQEPFSGDGDSTFQRYVVDGVICQVPHDYCPHCWGPWDFKLNHRECRHCGYSLGKEVKLLLDTDVCPNCEQGTVTVTTPTCNNCEFTVDPEFVTWG